MPKEIPTGIWVLIAVGVAIAALALTGYLTGAWDQPALPP
jgi:hypothetical protein